MNEPEFPTSLGTSTADEIRLLGQSLTDDLMGKVGFGELAFWLVTLRRPTPQETRVFEAVLVALADHGFTPTAIAARLTYLSAPDSLQGALAAGLRLKSLISSSRSEGSTLSRTSRSRLSRRQCSQNIASAAEKGPIPDWTTESVRACRQRRAVYHRLCVSAKLESM